MRISDWSSDVCSSDLSAGVFCVLFHLGPEWLIGPFSDDPEVLFYGAQFLRWISWNLLAMAAVMSCSGVFSGLGNTRSEEHTSELQSLMRISYAVFCLKKKKKTKHNNISHFSSINSITMTNTTT